MSQPGGALLTFYNPAEKQKDTLINEFVVRNDILEELLKDLKNQGPTKNLNHYLILAQRGAGKTTLLYRLKYAIEDDPKLREIVAVNFGEEQYNINSLSDLWQSLADVLEDYHQFRNISAKVSQQEKVGGATAAYKMLIAELKSKQNRLLLFIENFGDLLKKLQVAEIEELKAILISSTDFQIIAGTPISLESILDESKVSFDIFKTVELKGLDNEQTKTLLLKLAEVHGVLGRIERIITEKPERIEILRRLTGGVIRTMVLLFKIFIETEDGRSVRDLQLVLDSVTPLFKHRMDDLPPQQQKIVDVVAKNWDAISVKEITANTKIPSKIVSAQLRQLEKNYVIAKVATESKNHLYQLKERFFNIWYLMRYGRKSDKKRVTWLVRFFEAWCTRQELEERINLHIENLREKKYDVSSAILMGEAYVACNMVARPLKEKLIQTTATLYPKEFDANRFNLDADLLLEAESLVKEHNVEEALKRLDAVKEITKNNYRKIVSIAFDADDYERASNVLLAAEDKAFADEKDFMLLGNLVEMEGSNYEKAVEYFNKANALGAKDANFRIARLFYRKLKKVSEAEAMFLTMINEDPNNGNLYHELGHLYGQHLLDYDKAIANFQRSIELGRSEALYCLGALYQYQMNDFEMAKSYYLQEPPPESYVSLGKLYMELNKDFEMAIQYFQKALNEKNYEAYQHLGKAYEETGQNDLAVKNYLLEFDNSKNPFALHRIALVYRPEESTFKEAEKYFKLAIEHGDKTAMVSLARFYYENQINKSQAVELILKGKKSFKNDPYVHDVAANIMLWDERFDAAIDDLAVVFSDEEYVETELKYISNSVIRLIAREQYEGVLKLFSNAKVKDMLKPVYFALMKLMKDEFPNEFLKMGDEMAQTVEEIIDQINSEAETFNKKINKKVNRNNSKRKKK